MTNKCKLLEGRLIVSILIIFLSSCAINPKAWNPLLKPEFKAKSAAKAGAVIEHKGHLYLGGDIVSYVSKSKLN